MNFSSVCVRHRTILRALGRLRLNRARESPEMGSGTGYSWCSSAQRHWGSVLLAEKLYFTRAKG